MRNPFVHVLDCQRASLTDARQSIVQSYIELARVKGYDRITVKELCSKAHVSRSTFYAYYQNTRDVLEELENSIISEMVDLNPDLMNRGQNEVEELPFFHRTREYIEAHKTVFSLLLVEQPEYHFIEKLKDAIKYHFWERVFKDRNREDDMLLLDMLASVVISAYTYWLKHPYEMDEAYLLRVISNILKLIDGT